MSHRDEPAINDLGGCAADAELHGFDRHLLDGQHWLVVLGVGEIDPFVSSSYGKLFIGVRSGHE